MIQHEITERASFRLAQRLRWAKLPLNACVEDLDVRTARGLDPAELRRLIDLGWIREHLNVLVTGPTGVGKSFIACALAHAACRADFSVRCFRLPRLIEELARYGAMQRRSTLYRQLARADLLVIDDFGIAPLGDETVRDLLEVFDDRYDRCSTLITSQLPVHQWHAYLGDRTVAPLRREPRSARAQRLSPRTQRRLHAQAAQLRAQQPCNLEIKRPLTNTALLLESPHTASPPAGIDRNAGPTSIGMVTRHRRNPQRRWLAGKSPTIRALCRWRFSIRRHADFVGAAMERIASEIP